MKNKGIWKYILIIAAIFVLGFSVLGIVLGESVRLLVIDIKSGFADAGRYVKAQILFLVVAVMIAFYIWQCLFGTLKLRWDVHIKGKCFAVENGKLLKKNDFIWMIVSVLLICVGVGIIAKGYCQSECTRIWNLDATVGHSFGLVDGSGYTGSLEAFQENYALGQRTFEVDLALTSDNKVVLKHDWNYPQQEGISEDNIPTEEEFLEKKLNGKFTPMSFEQLCDFMMEYPDIWIVTDSKYTDEETIRQQFDALLATIDAKGAEQLLGRMVIQIYNEDMYRQLSQYGRFQSYIFTMYQRWTGDIEDFREVSRFCVNNGIDAMAISENLYNEEIQEAADRYGMNLYLHTVNEIKDAKKYVRSGICGVYTDTIMPGEMEEEK